MHGPFSKKEGFPLKNKTLSILFCLFILICTVNLSALKGQQEVVDPINWRELIPFLIDVKGWDALGDAEGQTIAMGTFKMTEVERFYEAGDKSLEINIVDGGYAPMAYTAIKMAMGFEIDTSEEYMKKISVKGFPGVERYSFEDKEGEVMILVEERFVVRLTGENVEETSGLVEIAKTLDLEGLAKLAK